MGDGRLNLDAEPSQQFDILVMDAFSGDSDRTGPPDYPRSFPDRISAISSPMAVLVVNITNNYLDLRPVMESSAAAVNKVAYAYDYESESDDGICFSCSWALMMDAPYT